MDLLNKWIYTVVIVVVFVTFIDILMPNSSIKKYTKLILGLLVMTVILQPVFSILKGDFSLTEDSFKFQNQLDSLYIQNRSAEYDEEKIKEITSLFKNNLEDQIKQQVRKEVGDRDIDVNVDIIEDTKTELYGQINSISILIGKGANEVEKVEKVDISGKSDKDNGSVAVAYESLRNKISSMYDLDKNRIQILTKK